MWEGNIDEKLQRLYDQYYELFGIEPDGHMEICYDGLLYEEYVAYIEECLEKKIDMVEVVK